MGKLAVVDLVDIDSSGPEAPWGGLGGWFNAIGKSLGHRWVDYLDALEPQAHPYAEAARRWAVENNVRRSGESVNHLAVRFSDNTLASHTFRGWGDFMAAVWSTEEDRDISYIDFYMSAPARGGPYASEREIDD